MLTVNANLHKPQTSCQDPPCSQTGMEPIPTITHLHHRARSAKQNFVTPSPRPNLSNFATVWLLSTFSPQPPQADCVGNKQPQPSPWLAIVIERWKRRRAEKNTRQIPVCGAYGALCPNLSPINFLGPTFFRNKFPFPQKGHNPQAYMVHKKYPESILGTVGANISG